MNSIKYLITKEVIYMDKSLKLYKRAVSLYSDGYIDRALECCEKSISNNIKNTSAINLKGLLYYFKGELDSAQSLWKMNFQVNRDLVSKKYLDDSKNDNNKKLVYQAALIAIKELNIREAVILLEKCRESDFNSLNVHNSLAICYIKLGEYNRAKKHIEEVFKIDRKNTIATKSKDELVTMRVIKRKFEVKYVSIALAGIALVFLINFSYNSLRKLFVVEQNNKLETIKTSQATSNLETSSKKEVPEKATPTTKEVFPTEELNKAVSEKDFEKLYILVNEWNNKDLSINDKTMLQNGVDLLKSNGIDYFYTKGRQALINKDYKSSENYFVMAYNYGKEYYLYQDILYMLGFSYKNEGEIDNCLKYYQEYDTKFSNGTYEETILYDMSIIYKPVDIKTSKDYASRLVKQYAKSIYNNSIIKSILSS